MDGNRKLIHKLILLVVVFAIAIFSRQSYAQEAQWIWSPVHAKDNVPRCQCYFRKQFEMTSPEKGEVRITADDRYEIYVNGTKVGAGTTMHKMDRYDISRSLVAGTNTIAIRVGNVEGNTAALAARVQVKNRGHNWESYSTDRSWKANLNTYPFWKLAIYKDHRWPPVQSFGQLGNTQPWDRPNEVKSATLTDYDRFQISKDFDVVRVAADEEVGSIIAFTFTEFGEIIYSREGEALRIVNPHKPVGDPLRSRIYCDQIKNTQGILPLNGSVFATGEGPQGIGLYKLSDVDLNGQAEVVDLVLKFKGHAGEHGPHGLTLGPDGLIYVVLGNHSGVEKYSDTSPVRHSYEGDVVTPRYEDPSGHAQGLKAPGGVVVRTDVEGKNVELVAGGLRNAYDLAFNASGELFTHDSDMESDLGTSWFRPTTVYHVISGAEFGWRSGWAKWPDYYVDALPGICDTGRGSPTGAVFYNHNQFPQRYRNSLFLGDWSEGRILAVHMKRSGSSYTANSEVFLQGDPLNVTDLAVSSDGSLYFSTGGRGTAGGIYRINWKKRNPHEMINSSADVVTRLIRQPQTQSAWARQNIANLQRELGDKFDQILLGVAISDENPAVYRTRALEIMQLFGPIPPVELLLKLVKSNNELVRAKAADLLALQDSPESINALIQLLEDSDRLVRRRACEGLLRTSQQVSFEQLQSILISDDRFEAWAGRRILERIPLEQWKEKMLTTEDQRLYVQGSTALMIAHPSKENAYAVLARASELMDGFVSDRNFVDFLRIMQLALTRGEINNKDIPAFRQRLAKEFPSGNSVMNRELIRLLAFLDIHEIGDRYVEFLKSPKQLATDKLHVAMYLSRIREGFDSGQRLAILDFLESARNLEGSGGSYPYYLSKAAQEFSKGLTAEDAAQVLARGEDWPNGAASALRHLPEQLSPEQFTSINRLDKKIAESEDPAYDRLKSGLIAILARSGDEASMDYLRKIWQLYPERRSDAAMGLAQHPDGENWPYIVSSLHILDERFAGDVLEKLTSVNRRPTDPEFYRQVILKGLVLKQAGAEKAIRLLEHWEGLEPSAETDWKAGLAKWQDWYKEKHPDRPAPELPVASENQKWNVAELIEYMGSEEAELATAERGQRVFEKAQCASCHRFGNAGKNIGPDLTSVAKRFSSKEILESIIYPSHVISDQYMSKIVTTLGGRQVSGLVRQDEAGNVVVFQSDQKEVQITASDVDEITHSPISSMPANLLDQLTHQEIADMFAYLGAIRNARMAHRAKVRTNLR